MNYFFIYRVRFYFACSLFFFCSPFFSCSLSHSFNNSRLRCRSLCSCSWTLPPPPPSPRAAQSPSRWSFRTLPTPRLGTCVRLNLSCGTGSQLNNNHGKFWLTLGRCKYTSKESLDSDPRSDRIHNTAENQNIATLGGFVGFVLFITLWIESTL